MPWCPQCKTEYQEGFKECKDCKVPLVDDLSDFEDELYYEPFFQSEDQKTAEKLASFFEYSGLPSQVSFDEEYQTYIVSIPPEAEKDARKLYEAFYLVEAERKLKAAQKADTEKESNTSDSESEQADEDLSDALEAEASSDYENQEYEQEEDQIANKEPSDEAPGYKSDTGSVYVMKAEQYNDLRGTVWIFLVFGIGGLLFVILNLTKIIGFLNGWLPNLVMSALFLFFLIVAFTTNKKAKHVRSQIDAENLLTRDINKWLIEHVTDEFLDSIYNDNISEEANYIRSADYIKELLIKEFGHQNLAYLDRVIDDFYNNNLYHNEEE